MSSFGNVTSGHGTSNRSPVINLNSSSSSALVVGGVVQREIIPTRFSATLSSLSFTSSSGYNGGAEASGLSVFLMSSNESYSTHDVACERSVLSSSKMLRNPNRPRNFLGLNLLVDWGVFDGLGVIGSVGASSLRLITFFLTKWQIFGVSDGVNGLSGDFDMNSVSWSHLLVFCFFLFFF